jgi:hypothetical protein
MSLPALPATDAAAAMVPDAGRTGLVTEFRRKLACGEALSRALLRLAEALRFSGRITVTFHQGHMTKTVLEEAYWRGRSGGG